ncbi:MAG TPA: hypothetical protein VFV72_12255 [Candidatus Limnocylindrales bacterium]|nr:hypothetical protein [Candidatus Limnocylindrales bacterium]
MPEPLLYLDRSLIHSSDVAGLRGAVANLVAFVREREPQLLFYGFEIDEPSATMRVVAIHPDSESLGTHLAIGGPEFRKVGAFIELQEIDVFGRPSAAVRDQLEQKAAMLGAGARVNVHELATGFARLTSAHG